MRVVQFIQVLILLLVVGYGVLVALDNPVLLHLPIPFAEREFLLPAGWTLLGALGIGILYGALLLWPLVWEGQIKVRHNVQRRRQAEASLQATLRARLAPSPDTVSTVSEAQP